MGKFLSGEAVRVLKNPDLRLFLAYRFFMTSATLMQSVIVGWQIYSLTNDVLLLGLIGLTEVIPQVSITLFAGHYADIWDRRKIIFYTSFLSLVATGILLIYSIPSLNMFQLTGTVPIFASVFLVGLIRGILMPAHTALLGQLVTRDQLTSAATWGSTVWHVAAITGPAIGGLVYGFAGVVEAYSVVLLFYSLCTLLIFKIKSPGKIISVNAAEEGIFNRIKEGIVYVFKNQVLLGAFALDMFAVLFGGAVAMLPVFASDILHTGPQGLGLLRASPAIGAIIMAIILILFPPVKNSGKLMLYSVLGFGLSMIVFAVSKNFILSAAALFFSGVFDNVSVVVRHSILQLFASDEMKGRVASVNSIFIGSSNELGAFESGVAARLMGLVPSVIFGGAMTILIVVITAWISKPLRELSLSKSV